VEIVRRRRGDRLQPIARPRSRITRAVVCRASSRAVAQRAPADAAPFDRSRPLVKEAADRFAVPWGGVSPAPARGHRDRGARSSMCRRRVNTDPPLPVEM
jgi:hypothetical protein